MKKMKTPLEGGSGPLGSFTDFSFYVLLFLLFFIFIVIPLAHLHDYATAGRRMRQNERKRNQV